MNKILKINTSKKDLYILISILILSFSLRIIGLNWDQGHHLHPDERQITMVATDIKFPESRKISQILSPNSSLNPKFFAYGSLPIYLLKFSGYVFSFINPDLLLYEKINLLGRFLSVIFDTLTVFIIYLITKQLFSSNKKALLASLVYTLSVFPIQLSHFYAVDTLLTFFICLTLYRLIVFYRQSSAKNSIILGICFGLSLATKVSAIVLLVSIFLCFIKDTLFSLKKEVVKQKISHFKKINKYLLSLINPIFWIKNQTFSFKKTIFYLLLILIFTTITFIICQPFSIIDFPTFWQQINEQSVMTKNAFVFPYTLQYVGTTPYWYYLKNIFLWGLGPSFGLLSLIGLISSFKRLIMGTTSSSKEGPSGTQFIIFSFFITYFLVVGAFAVKFMRYFLPLYPIFAILSANALMDLKKKTRLLIFFLNLIWVISFLNIYNRPNTRVSATYWIEQNIPSGSTILREHWDDGLPLGYHNEYVFDELSLYNSDRDPKKWVKINQQLQEADYLIIASNRLYTPLQKLTNCPELPLDSCYNKTAKYYQNLFSENLGYKKVAEFTSYPSFLGININDQFADESFTVYDHPKVLIFKNNGKIL